MCFQKLPVSVSDKANFCNTVNINSEVTLVLVLQDMYLNSNHLVEWKRVTANQNCEPITSKEKKYIHSYAKSIALYFSMITRL